MRSKDINEILNVLRNHKYLELNDEVILDIIDLISKPDIKSTETQK